MKQKTKKIQRVKTSIQKEVKEKNRLNQFLTYISKGNVACVFYPTMKSKERNQLISMLAESYYSLSQVFDEVNLRSFSSQQYPINLRCKSAFTPHNVLISVEDQRQLEYEGVDKDVVCGKSIQKAYEWHQHLFGEIEPRVYKKCLRKLVRDDLIVPTRFGTIWYKPYFGRREDNYEFALTYNQFVQKV